MSDDVQVYRMWIKATPEAVWGRHHVTRVEDRYGYGGLPEYGDLIPGRKYVINAGTGMQAGGVTGPVIDGELPEVAEPFARLRAVGRRRRRS